MVCFSGKQDHGRCRGGIVKGKMYLNLFEAEGPGAGDLRSSLRNFSGFSFPRTGFSTFSEANLLDTCCNLRIY